MDAIRHYVTLCCVILTLFVAMLRYFALFGLREFDITHVILAPDAYGRWGPSSSCCHHFRRIRGICGFAGIRFCAQGSEMRALDPPGVAPGSSVNCGHVKDKNTPSEEIAPPRKQIQ